MAKFRDVLKNRDFFFLWLGQIISNFGDSLAQMALIALVYKRSPGSVMELAKVVFFTVVPVFIIGPVAGVYVDRWNRKWTMIISDILRGLLVFLIPLLIVFTKPIFPIYIVVFLMFSVTRFFLPCKMAIIPEIVSKDELLIANSLIDTTRMIANTLGFALAGFVVKWVGIAGSFYIDSLSFFVSAIFIGFIGIKIGEAKIIPEAKSAIKSAIKKTIWFDMIEGLKFLLQYKKARFVVGMFFILMSGIGAIFCVSIVFVQKSFNTVTTDLGFLGMNIGIGLFLGTVFYGRFGQNFSKIHFIFFSFISTGIALIVFSLLTRFYSSEILSGVAALLIGIFISPVVTSGYTLIHEEIPNGARGRIFSSLEAIMHSGFLIFMFVASVLAAFTGALWILIATGVFFILSGILGATFNSKRGFIE